VTRIAVSPRLRYSRLISICMSRRRLRSSAATGFVEQQDPRPDGERAGERHALLLAA
jgi:hypothetical protein